MPTPDPNEPERKLAEEPTGTLDGPAGDVTLDQGKMSAGCIFAVNTLDRVGDVLNIQGINCDNHRKNPQVLFNHKADNLDDSVGLTLSPEGDYTVVLGEDSAFQTTFFCRNNLLAEQLYDRIVAGQIRANSIGYRTLKKRKNNQGGYFLDETELIEVSWVVIGANQDAIRSCLSRGRLCGKGIHPSLRAAFQAQLPAKTTVVAGGFTMLKLLEKAKKDLPPEGAAAAVAEAAPEPKVPHGAGLLASIHSALSGIIAICDEQLPAMDNADTEAAVLEACDGVIDLINGVAAAHKAGYPDLEPLAAVEKPGKSEAPATEAKDEEEAEGDDEEAKSATAAAGKSYSGAAKRLTKAMGSVIRECAEHLTEMKDAENLTSAQRLVCKHYSQELGSLAAEKAEVEAPAVEEKADEDEVAAMEKAYAAMSKDEQAEFDAEVKSLFEQAEREDQAEGFDAAHQVRLARAAAARNTRRPRFEV